MRQTKETENKVDNTDSTEKRATPERFRLGCIVATPGVLKALEEEGIGAESIVERHVRGDWGEVTECDRKTNENAVRTGGVRILSSYRLPQTRVRIWVITEADWSATTLLLPTEY